MCYNETVIRKEVAKLFFQTTDFKEQVASSNLKSEKVEENMPTDNEEVRELEKNYKDSLFERVNKIGSDLSEIISHIQKTGRHIDLESDLPNLGITLYNKLVELQSEFKNAGLSIYIKKYEKDGVIGTSFIGDAIIEDLLSYGFKAGQNLIDYHQTMSEINGKKAEQLQALEKVSPLRRFLVKIKNLFAPGTQELVSYTQEETDTINIHLSHYKETDNELWNYNLREKMIPNIVRKIRERGYGACTVPGLLEENIIPDLQKLGLVDLIPELQQTLIEEYKKDLPASENYQVREEDMHLYVPDFSRKSVRNPIRNGIEAEDLVLIDKTVTAGDRQTAIKAIQDELQPTQESNQDRIEETTDVSRG